MVSFCGWFKSKRRGRRGEEEKPEGKRRTSEAAPEEEKAMGSDEEEEEEEEGEKNVESSPLPSEEEESEGNGGEGDKEGDDEKKVEAPAEEKPKGSNGKKAKKQGGKHEKKEGDGEKENRTKEPLSPSEEIELRVSMHCDGCARKIRCVLKRYEGVAEVAADWRAQKVVVKGQKAAASSLKAVEHLERETDKKVQLLTPLPPPQPGKKKPKAKDQLKKKKKEEEEEDKKEEIVVASFKLQMHCPACAQKIAKKIVKMQGVESAEADWEASKVTVRGVFTAEKLAGYVYQKTTKYVVVTRDEPAAAPEKVEEETSVGGGEEEEKDESGGGTNLSGDQEEEEDAIDEGEDAEDEMTDKSSGEGKKAIGMQASATKVAEEEEATLKQCCQPCSTCETRYPPNVCPLCGRGFFDPVQPYPAIVFPHIFSDENPNACSLM